MPFYQATKNQRSGTGSGFLEALDRDESIKSKGFYASINNSRKSSADLESVDGLLKLARQKGLLGEAEEITEEDKLSFLQRLSSGLGSLNPAEALARAYEGTENFLIAYPKTVIQGIASALTGNDYGEQTKRRYFSDLVKNLDTEDSVARFGLGLAGDILLDPSTWFGGSIARYAVKGTSAVTRTAFKGLEKVAPEVSRGLTIAGKGTKDALGELFVDGYGASKKTKEGLDKGLLESYYEFDG